MAVAITEVLENSQAIVISFQLRIKLDKGGYLAIQLKIFLMCLVKLDAETILTNKHFKWFIQDFKIIMWTHGLPWKWLFL